MTDSIPKRTARRGRIFPEHNWSEEKKARYNLEKEAFYQRCRVIFERASSESSGDRYNWYIVIEPESGDYFIDPDEEVAASKARQQYPDAWIGIFRLNETGACGKI